MTVTYIELKNRRLMIEREKIYNVDTIEKNDIVRLKPGRLLLDVIIFSGVTKAIESVMNGSEDSKQYEKGDRLRLGSIISETDSLAQV
jgi:cation transport ATPase